MDIRTWMMPYREKAIELRRGLHAHPELSFQEYETAAFIRNALEDLNIELQELEVETAVTGVIYGEHKGPNRVIRADIDALPIIEDTDLAFKSQNVGVSHSCGHDIHMAILWLVACVLSEHRDALKGSVRVVFQPAEETGEGAKLLLEKGLLDLEPKGDIVLGMHTSPDLEVGRISVADGVMNASTDQIDIEIKSEGGHGAYPYKCSDPIVTAGYLLTQLQTLASRETPALNPIVLTFGYLHGGTAANIIPTSVVLKGNLRTFDNDIRKQSLKAINRIASGVALCTSSEIAVSIKEGIPVLKNDYEITHDFIKSAAAYLGEEHIKLLDKPFPGSDDFSCYLAHMPGVYFKVGTANASKSSQLGIHNPKNIYDEESIFKGALAILAYIFKPD